jgi:hypothetical protein
VAAAVPGRKLEPVSNPAGGLWRPPFALNDGLGRSASRFAAGGREPGAPKREARTPAGARPAQLSGACLPHWSLSYAHHEQLCRHDYAGTLGAHPHLCGMALLMPGWERVGRRALPLPPSPRRILVRIMPPVPCTGGRGLERAALGRAADLAAGSTATPYIAWRELPAPMRRVVPTRLDGGLPVFPGQLFVISCLPEGIQAVIPLLRPLYPRP